MNERSIIKKIIYEIFNEKNIKIQKIVLFGSRARKEETKHSDWDLLIIIKENIPRKQKKEIAHLIRKKLADKYIPCDLIIKSEEEIEYYKNFIGSVTREALKEGVEI